ncbi:MAG: hypothetical protein JWP12_2832 [Bacteroidetes bacterium]|nr:hypothetical protein [Bacteroidota bacterium]
MKKIIAFFFVCFLLNSHFIKAQDSCITAYPFCSGTIYNFNRPAGIAAPTGPDYGCLSSQQSPLWFSIHVTTSGPIDITGAGLDSADNPMDIDFIYWGPYSTLTGVCYSQLDAAHIAGCDYSTNNVIDVNLPSAVAGSYYIAMVSNYAGIPANISYSQTSGTGEASCVLPCSFTSMTAAPGACNPADNKYNLSGSLNFVSPPSTGTLTVFGSCGGSQTFSPPFTSPQNYTFNGLNSNGNSCFVNALFSANSSCNINQTYTAPIACNPFLGLAAYANEIGLKIAPNPSNGIFNISFQSGSPDEVITITDIAGRKVYQEIVVKSTGTYSKQIDLTAFDKGIYFVKVAGEKGSSTQKIIYN